MKRFLISIKLFLCLLILAPNLTYASTDSNKIKVIINLVEQNNSVQPIINNNTILVPLRLIMNGLHAQVHYSNDSKQITLKLQDSIVTLTANNTKAFVNGQAVDLQQPPILHENITFVPLRFLSESFGATVNWDNNSKVVSISYLPNTTEFMLYDTMMRDNYEGFKAILEAKPSLANKASEIVAIENPSLNYSYLELALSHGADPNIALKIALQFEHSDLLYYLMKNQYIKVDNTLFDGGYSVFGLYSPNQKIEPIIRLDNITHKVSHRGIQHEYSMLFDTLIEYGYTPNANDAAIQLKSPYDASINSLQQLMEHDINPNSNIGQITIFTKPNELTYISLEDSKHTTTLLEMSAELALHYKELLYVKKLDMLVTSYHAQLNAISDEALQQLIILADNNQLNNLKATLEAELQKR